MAVLGAGNTAHVPPALQSAVRKTLFLLIVGKNGRAEPTAVVTVTLTRWGR